MNKRFARYGVTLSKREEILVRAAHTMGMADAYNRYREALETEDPSKADDLNSDIHSSVSITVRELGDIRTCNA